LAVQMDGETAGTVPITCEVMPSSIRLMKPPES